MQILTWNIRWGCGCDDRVDFDRVADVIRADGDPDVICLQEVAINHPGLTASRGENQVDELVARLPGYSAHYAIGSDLMDGSGAGKRRLFGNLIMSKHPVLQVFRHSLPWPADLDVPSMPRVAIEAVVATPDETLRVVTTHLEYYSILQRRAQLQGLRAILAEGSRHALRQRPDEAVDPPFKAQPRPAAVVCCGDFNCAPDAPELEELLRPQPAGAGENLLDAWRIAHPGLPHAHTVGLHGCDWPDHPYCCDYFIVSENLTPRVAAVAVNQQTSASDHQPVMLTLR